LYTALLLAASTCLAWDGAWSNPGYGGSYGSYYGGSYGGLENGYNPSYAAAWAPWSGPVWLPWTGGCCSVWWGGYGSYCRQEHCLTRLGEHMHHRQDGAPPDRGNSGFSGDSCPFAGPGETWSECQGCGQGGAPDLGAPAVVPTDQTSPAPAAGGDKK
jgi:hypothetical protein